MRPAVAGASDGEQPPATITGVRGFRPGMGRTLLHTRLRAAFLPGTHGSPSRNLRLRVGSSNTTPVTARVERNKAIPKAKK